VAEFDKLAAWNAVTIERVIGRIAAALDKKARDIARPFYVAITGSATSIPLYDSMELLGRDLVRERLRNAIDLLGAPSKRELQEWETLLQSDEVAV
jgi:glutamyl-tRNA synthetase